MPARSAPNRRTPTCDGEVLRDERGPTPQRVRVGGPDWFAWLREPANRAFAYADGRGAFTARREARRGGEYWYAYRRRDGRLHNAYLGRADDLTPARLAAVAARLAGAGATPALPR